MLDMPTEKQIVYLLGKLCVQLGLCSIPEDRWEALVLNPPSDADDFTEAVFEAEGEGFDPELRRQAREIVARTFKR